MTKPTDPIPYLLIEVTVSGAFIDTESRIIGDNVSDATVQFGWRADDLPASPTDDFVRESLRKQLGPVVALIQFAMTSQKWVYMGSVEEPHIGRGTVVGKVKSDDITVIVPMGDGPKARA